MGQVVESAWVGPVVTSLLALISGLLTLLIRNLNAHLKEQKDFNTAISAKVEAKVEDKLCVERRDACPVEILGCQFRRHSHTGLDKDAAVIVKEG